MASVPTSSITSGSTDYQNQNNTGPLIVITILFFMWGVLTSLNDVLIPHLKAIYTLTYVQAMLVQFCFFGAYFIVSLPAGALIKKIGYQNGAVVGLVVAAGGCALFYPASLSTYGFFLFAFFVLAAGITILQVAANPYVAVLGDPKNASSRLTLTQAFNSLGTTIAPFIGGRLILSGNEGSATASAAMTAAEQTAFKLQEAALVQGPYLALGAALLGLGLFFYFAKLPKITHDVSEDIAAPSTSVLKQRHLVLGAIGIFLYVGGEVTIGSFLINFLGEPTVMSMPHATAAEYVSLYWGAAMIGRFIGFVAMRSVSPGKALAFNALVTVILIGIAIVGRGQVAMYAIIAVGLFNSIMFPTIFSMALYRLGAQTGQGSGVLCMAIVGGAIVPFAQGLAADQLGLHLSFLVPAACYLYILFFGVKYANLYDAKNA
jgi:MFS transporter, FHS family, L-fucose permease